MVRVLLRLTGPGEYQCPTAREEGGGGGLCHVDLRWLQPCCLSLIILATTEVGNGASEAAVHAHHIIITAPPLASPALPVDR